MIGKTEIRKELVNIISRPVAKSIEAKATDVSLYEPAVKDRLQRKTSTTNALSVVFEAARIASPPFHPIANSLCGNRNVSSGYSKPRVGS